jgi:hypothetical protein
LIHKDHLSALLIIKDVGTSQLVGVEMARVGFIGAQELVSTLSTVRVKNTERKNRRCAIMPSCKSKNPRTPF